MGFQTTFSNNFIAIWYRGVRYYGLIVHFRGFCIEALFHPWIISSCTEPLAKTSNYQIIDTVKQINYIDNEPSDTWCSQY